MFDYPDTPDLLKGKTILVTGATGGIGRWLSLTYASLGATVILLGRNISKLEALYDEIESAGYTQPAIYPMNLEGATEKDYDELALVIEKEFGQLDGLVHNAATLGSMTSLQGYDAELWYKVMQVNLNAPFLLTRALIPLLNKAASASIVFVSDTSARKGKAYWGAYSIAKAGLENMMQILHDEVEANTAIRVNSIDPGPVRTPMRMSAYPAEDINTVPLPEDVMKPFVFLVSDASKDVRGQALNAQD